MYSEKAKRYSPIHYALFVNYFPHLIAGPILHHADMMPQFDSAKNKTNIASDLSIGTSILLIGLGKKLLLADPLGGYVNIFYVTIADSKTTPGFFESITVSLAYTLQLYFDFSGYSDMAIGISRMFGVDLPINFNSPYKSKNIIEFWRRWHISLSTFLRDYLYIPLGGSKKGAVRRFANLFTTMVLGGIWHGAGWTFILWGGIHGSLLILNHAFQASISKLPTTNPISNTNARRILSIIVTFSCVSLAWIPFRAPNIETAAAVLAGVFGLHGAALPSQILAMAPFLGAWVTSVGNVPLLADGTVMGFIEMSVMILIGMYIAFFTSNTQEMTNRSRLLVGALTLPFLVQKIFFGGKVEFLYFQF
jgi:D-alanyl-lipoteichoic acid acyltransferase DltB (MBOAT superfamily)